MLSMTGFGSASRSRRGLSVTVEARSVNNRFLKLSLRVPGVLSSREHEIEALVRERVQRGTVYVIVRVALDQPEMRIRLNEAAVREYGKLLGRLKRAASIGGEPDLDLLSRLPGVFDAQEVEQGLPDEAWEVVRETVIQALDRMVRMRKREGGNLLRDFRQRRAAIAKIVAVLSRRAPTVVEEYVTRLSERVSKLLSDRGVTLEDRDLIRELAIFAERSDVTEEVTRLKSHLSQFAKALAGSGSRGRKLDFLIQEMLREANTVSSKASDVEMSRHCVDLKVELDRLKEQVQNVE